MANKPVLGMYECPHCGGKCPIIWNGNRKVSCMHCKKQFTVKRQKLKNVVLVKPPQDGEGENADGSKD